MTTVARAEVPRSRIAVASFIGTAIEFYDFYIYGTALFYTVTTFCLSLGTSSLHIPRTTMLVAALVAAAVMGVATLGFAMCSDRWGRRRLSAVAAGLAAVWAFPLFALLQTRNPVLVTIALVGGLFCFAMLYGPMGAFLPELFRVRYRYSGASVAYSASGVVGGGIVPIVATDLWASTGSSVPVAALLIVIAALSLACILALPETRDHHFTDGAGPRPAGRGAAAAAFLASDEAAYINGVCLPVDGGLSARAS